MKEKKRNHQSLNMNQSDNFLSLFNGNVLNLITDPIKNLKLICFNEQKTSISETEINDKKINFN